MGLQAWSAVALTLGASGCGRFAFDPEPDAGAPDGSADAVDALAVVCHGLAPTCGASGTDDCCASPPVTGGSYARSYDVSGDGNFANQAYVATLSDYRLDKYEITVGRFRQFVEAGFGTQANPPAIGDGAHAGIGGSGWSSAFNTSLLADTTALIAALKCNATEQMWTDVPGANENRPMNCITWYEAFAFCIWDGGYLPTEAEWDYAAAGGSEQRAFPWSMPANLLSIDPSRGSYYDGVSCVGDGMAGCGATDILPVGARPAGDGKFLQSDLGGNIWEWTLDKGATPYAINPCIDCADLTSTGGRISRGGYFSAPIIYIRSANRFGNGETFRVSEQGARCARRF
ncbi:MAG TPA: formylglycine-generating enzyme family protein [Kofleriaceae bacterium]|nr:formylglycine-generating enzyme family protein [Kofleriaceae bacterium]